jgi:hypothetical protein
VTEYAFELALCRQLEAERDGIVSRQLSTGVHGRRVMDVVCVSPGPEFDERLVITPETIPPAAVESGVGAGVATYWKGAFDCHPERAASAVERAVERGFFERERRNGRTYVRQTTRYPDWYGRLLGIENKPDLGRPGALETQLLTDVELGLLDRIVLATASHVTGAHLNRIPDAVGVWRFDPDTGEREVLREPAQLPAGEHGIEILDRSSTRAEIRVATPEDLRRARLRVAERAYGKGWRTYDLPDCERVEPDDAGVPFCPWKGRIVRPAVDCGPACGGYDPDEQPAVDLRRLRAERSSWDPEPGGRQREQSGLDQFTDS